MIDCLINLIIAAVYVFIVLPLYLIFFPIVFAYRIFVALGKYNRS